MTEINLRLKIAETIREREEFKKDELSEEDIKAKIDYIKFAVYSISKMEFMAIKAERFKHAAIWASLKIVMADVNATNILANTLLVLLKVLERKNKDER